MLVLANCLGLFFAGIGVGASLEQWHATGAFGFAWTSLLIGIIAGENLRRLFSRKPIH